MTDKNPAVEKRPKKQIKQPVPTAPVAPSKSRNLEITEEPGESMDRVKARLALGATIPNASTALDYSIGLFPDLSFNECAKEMKSAIHAVNGGNLDSMEGILAGQVMALNAIFNNFAKRAAHSDSMQKLEAYLRLALKAQSQCRTTVEAIAEIKYPKSATFIKQANIAGQQQVNNGAPTRTPEKNITPTNELLTEQTHAALDAGGTGATICSDTGLEAVGTLDRPH